MSALFFYSLHQRILASDCELRFLSPADPVAEPELTLALMTRAAPRSGTPWHRVAAADIEQTAAGELVMRFGDGTHFLVGADGRSIALIDAPAEYTVDDLAAYALGPVLTIALHVQGAVLLHAAAVAMNGRAIVFAGNSGSGKSTTAAMLHLQGWTVLSDDITEVSGGRALPAIPAIRLWPDVLDVLYGSAAAFPDHAPSWDKKILVTPRAAGAHEIAAVLFLDRGGEPRFERLPPREGWQRLMACVPTAQLPGKKMQRKIFETTSALADGVPMYTFTAPPLERAETLPSFLAEHLP
ncbi:MAG TPA: hypothetical protein VE974_24010 [Thermoanaerobaculia bacterium]|nr:hypothetical protein [Thermoanaerobaculia bacterium]